jgi:ParB family chromosome partitioning protein
VALIRTYGLLQPLVVRRVDGKPAEFEVVAGHRRLKALHEIHKDDGDPKVHCVRCDVDPQTAEAVSLAENFAREQMHPLDEAEAFARLAREDAMGVESIASDFGVSHAYVRQRMKLATLAEPVRAAYRQDQINTASAEAFASVPADRQLQVWKEVNGRPQHAQHVRNVIAHAWIEADRALFDVSALPEGSPLHHLRPQIDRE